MVDYAASSINPAGTGAWVHAVLVLTCFGARTVSIDGAFGSARHIWISKIFWDALACCSPLSIRAYGILSTRSWVARIYNVRWCLCYK